MRVYLPILFLILCSSVAFSQDYVRLLDGTHYEAAKITKVYSNRIWFKPYAASTAQEIKNKFISSYSDNGTLHVFDTTVIKVPTKAEREQEIENLRAKLTQKKTGNTQLISTTEAKPQQTGPVTYFSDNASIDKNALYNSGTQDAYQYYKGYKGAGTGTYLTTFLLSPIGGLITAIATSSTPPKEQNLMYPDHELWKTGSYQSGYKNEAGKIKRRKVWKNFGLGIASWVGFAVITSALVAQ